MGQIKVKTEAEVALIRLAAQVAAKTLAAISQEVKPGVTTEYLDKIAEKMIREQGAEPVFIGYRGYRHATCISVNEQVVHGIPGAKVLREGDIVSLDVGTKMNGYCGDCALTVPVGHITPKQTKLLRVGKEALKAAIRQARRGQHLGDISAAVQRTTEKNGFSVVRDLYGHGIGRDLHEEPLIPNYGQPGEGPELKAGMVLAIEPMLTLGTWKIKTLADGWTVVTEDQSWACHFEKTVLITESEPEILTCY